MQKSNALSLYFYLKHRLTITMIVYKKKKTSYENTTWEQSIKQQNSEFRRIRSSDASSFNNQRILMFLHPAIIDLML